MSRMNDFILGGRPLDGTMMYVSLYDITGPVIIVPSKTGVVYTNQTDGCACNHPELEGYLIVPACRGIHYQPINPRIFDPDWWYLRHVDFEEELVPQIEDMLNVPYGIIKNLKVMKDRRWEEAWVWIEFDYIWCSGLDIEPTHLEAILTWPNSD